MALINCKECGTEVSSKAETCPKCGARVVAKTMRYVLLIGIIFLGGVIISVFSNIFSSSTGINSSSPQTSLPSVPISQKADTWTYGESKDEMRGTVKKYATTKSTNTVNFGFPYEGDQHGTILTVVDSNEVLYRNTATLLVEKGQITCRGGSKAGTCDVLVKFDDGEAKYVNAVGGGGSNSVLFIEPSFFKELKASKKLMIQAEVSHNSLPVFYFDVGGLKLE